ncbi:hypothetical protein VP01_4260g1 [Puccinia sorghi]|uniref:Retroviral polymerase SH3-like domain-containing protein n=1 Tax=Puccinia sorghi TaxID=27349 RepID=A0A0L6UQC6_9BASI|nr:hypothetical protein VP01_4260g1 [Puccinia sorghi]
MNSFSVSNSNGRILSGQYVGNLPTIDCNKQEHKNFYTSSEILHKSLGHVSYHRLRQRLGILTKDSKSCEACAMAKVTKKILPHSSFSCVQTFRRSPRGSVDSCTRYCSAIPITSKSDVSETISQAVSLEAKYFSTIIHSDRGTEFINAHLMNFCNENMIREHTGLNKRLWNEIVKTSALTLNQIPSHRSKNSPYELFKGRKLPLEFFKPVGNRVSYLVLPEQQLSKLESKGLMGTLIGYNDELRSYRILGDNGRIIYTSHLKFMDPEHPRSITCSDDSELLIVSDDVEASPDPEPEILETPLKPNSPVI